MPGARQTKDKILSLWVTEDLRAALERLAERDGESLSSHLRRALAQYVEREDAAEQEAAQQDEP